MLDVGEENRKIGICSPCSRECRNFPVILRYITKSGYNMKDFAN